MFFYWFVFWNKFIDNAAAPSAWAQQYYCVGGCYRCPAYRQHTVLPLLLPLLEAQAVEFKIYLAGYVVFWDVEKGSKQQTWLCQDDMLLICRATCRQHDVILCQKTVPNNKHMSACTYVGISTNIRNPRMDCINLNCYYLHILGLSCSHIV